MNPPSSLFSHLANVWRHLALRSDVDDVVLELLGRFSLDRIYAETSTSTAKHGYQRLVMTLLAQLNAVFFLQRLTVPAEGSVHAGRSLGLLVSWDLTVRCIELVLHVVADGRDILWESRRLRDKHLADFLLSALRLLTLHPRPAAAHRARRDRFARIRKDLEQVFDSYPGDKSFLLLAARDVANQLCADADALALPRRLGHELPSLTSELYPLSDSLSPPSIADVVSPDSPSDNWLCDFLTLRDMSHFVVAASIQYAANHETRDVRLQASSARSRNAVLRALDALRLPAHLPKQHLVAAFNSTFRIILPDTLDLAPEDPVFDSDASLVDGTDDLDELDALDALARRLSERQIVHRVSDAAAMQAMSQVVRDISLHDSPAGHFGTSSRPNLHVLNCSECHLIGGAQLRAHDIQVPVRPTSHPTNHQGSSPVDGLCFRLPPGSACPICRQDVSLAREVVLARRTWDALCSLDTDAESINAQRHLPATQFQMPPPPALDTPLSPGGHHHQRSTHHDRLILPDPTPTESSHTGGSQSLFPPPLSPSVLQVRPDRDRLMSDAASTYFDPADRSSTTPQEPTSAHTSPPTVYTKQRESYDPAPARRASEATVATVPVEKPKSRWRRPFTSAKKPISADPAATPAPTPAPAPAPVHTSGGDSSSLSSGALENPRVEEIPLGSLMTSSGGSSKAARGRASKIIHTYLSQSSALALFWSQLSIQIWDVGTSPPTMLRGISTESTCILAAVSSRYLAYMIGTRDQKLTLRIVNLAQPSAPAVEYRMPSSPWSRSIAIDRNENYVAVGFDESTVRFFKTASAADRQAAAEPPREDRLHSLLHDDCAYRRCPPVDTLSFSHDGLALLAGTRSPRSGHIQLFLWRFPFVAFHELTSCRYHVPLHESEDNGLTAAVLQSGHEGEDNNLVCVTTWTQSGTPVLVQPRGGHRSAIRSPDGGRQGKVGNRIQCAAFSPSGQELAVVNDKGILYQISRVNSSPFEISRLATSRELTAKSPSFSMGYVASGDEHSIVMVWADSAKDSAWVKKIPVASTRTSIPTNPAAAVYDIASRPDLKTLQQRAPFRPTLQKSPEFDEVQMAPVELAAERIVRELDATELSPTDDGGKGRKTSPLPGFSQYKP